jgi:hypothetical protein
MLHIDHHKNFKAIGQAKLAVSKITDGMSISSINRNPIEKYQTTDFIFFLHLSSIRTTLNKFTFIRSIEKL